MSALLLAYIFCLIVGGAFVALSVFGGLFEADADAALDADLDVDADMDADFALDADLDGHDGFDPFGDIDHDYDHDNDIEVNVSRRFNPLTSFKFYTFAMAFFGLSGIVFTLLGLWGGPTGVFVVATLLGLVSGLGVAYLMHQVNRSSGGSGVTAGDYRGASGKVVLPVRSGKRGKIRMQIKGRTIEMLAESTDDEVVFDMNDECFILGVDDGIAKVVDPSELDKSTSG